MKRTSYNIDGHVHFITFSCYRRCQLLADEMACRLLAKSLQTARLRHDFALWSYVFMPDHVHLMIRPRLIEYSMPHILKSIKGPCARWLVEHWQKNHANRLKRLTVRHWPERTRRVWQKGGGFDRNLYSEELIRRAVRYIEWNPVRRGIVDDPLAWKWSSARARAGAENVPIAIDPISWFQTPLSCDHAQSEFPA